MSAEKREKRWKLKSVQLWERVLYRQQIGMILLQLARGCSGMFAWPSRCWHLMKNLFGAAQVAGFLRCWLSDRWKANYLCFSQKSIQKYKYTHLGTTFLQICSTSIGFKCNVFFHFLYFFIYPLGQKYHNLFANFGVFKANWTNKTWWK